MKYPNLFRARYPSLSGRDWIKRVDKEDKQAWIHIGFAESGYGRLGGKARTSTAKRDTRGRFIRNEKKREDI